MRIPFLCITLLALWCCTPAALLSQDNGPFILLVVPEADTTVTPSPVYRLSGSTNPGRAISINGIPYEVFPSGAFAGLLDLSVGENQFVIQSRDPNGGVFEKRFLIIRTPPPETTRVDTLVIEDDMMMPQNDMWLNAGDILEVQMKGTPGCRAFFLDGIPMHEALPAQAGGLGGVYRGMYKVTDEDSMEHQPIQLVLVNSSGDSVVRYTGARISFRPEAFPLVGVTKGSRPALDFGLGRDRLGGAKLSFINPGIRLAITGKVGQQYRVDLSENNVAWIDEDQVDLQPEGTFPPFSLTGNFSVYGDNRYDYVAIAVADKLPYSTTQELEPTRIHIDLYGAVSNSNWITQQLSAQEVSNVYYTQVGRNHFRITIELRHRQVWGYSVGYVDDSLVIRIRHQPAELRLRGMIIAVDAGHGGSNEGALGSTGALEKYVTLATAYHLKRLLEREGALVLMTRTDDTFSFNSARLTRILQANADMLVSIHANSVGLTSNPLLASGASTYYKYICYRRLSQFILDDVLKTGLSSFGNVGSFNFTLNSPTELPNVLVELAFMSHPEDEMKLLDDDFRKELAGRIVDGIQDFLDWCDD
jgi:N-acetylmuramoyl-L-alanine amidase